MKCIWRRVWLRLVLFLGGLFTGQDAPEGDCYTPSAPCGGAPGHRSFLFFVLLLILFHLILVLIICHVIFSARPSSYVYYPVVIFQRNGCDTRHPRACHDEITFEKCYIIWNKCTFLNYFTQKNTNLGLYFKKNSLFFYIYLFSPYNLCIVSRV